MKRKGPKFSVIIPAHNEEDVIKRAIDSVLNQTYQNFEIIVSNDGSTDRTKEIVEKIIKKDKRIKILNRKKGHSAAFARNRGAEKAKGEILVFLDSDTYLSKEILEEINKKSNKADAFTFNCSPISTSFISYALSGMVNRLKKDKDREIFGKGSSFYLPSFFCIKNKVFKKIGKYNETIFYYEDEEIVKRFYDSGFKSIFIDKGKQYFELPSTFTEFLRQCKWIGKGTNSINDQDKKDKQRKIWILKSLFLISPLFFLWNLNYALGIFLLTLIITYGGLVLRNRKPVLSITTLLFIHIKTFLVTFNIFKFWK